MTHARNFLSTKLFKITSLILCLALISAFIPSMVTQAYAETSTEEAKRNLLQDCLGQQTKSIALVIITPEPELYGIYIAPKFIFSYVGTKMSLVGTPATTASKSIRDSTFAGALAVGYDFNPRLDWPMRVELEYAYYSRFKKSRSATIYNSGVATNDIMNATASINIQSLFANVYYDFHNKTNFVPYIGAGIGIAFVGTEAVAASVATPAATLDFGKKNQTNFAWNVGIGCAYKFTKHLAFEIGYRYAQFGDSETRGETLLPAQHFETDTIDSHQAIAALRFTF